MDNELLKVARSVVQQVLNTVAQEKNKLQSQIKEPVDNMMKAMVAEVWVAPDADEFKEGLTKVLVLLEDILGVVQRVDSGVQNGLACIDKADSGAAGKIQALNDVFAKIY